MNALTYKNTEELLRDEIESTNTAENRATKNSGDSLVAMIASMNQTMAAMAGSIFSMGNALKRLHADTASPPNDKRPKTTTACHDEPCDEASLDESADLADSSELLQVTRARHEMHFGYRGSHIYFMLSPLSVS